MIIDFHTHVFPPAVRKNRQQFFADETAFKCLYESDKSRLVGFDELLATMDDNQIDKSVIFGFPWKNPELIKKHNDYIMEAVSKHPGRFFGLCCFDMMFAGAGEETERCLQGGLSGVGELAAYEQGIGEAAYRNLEATMNLCKENNVPVLIHANEPVGHNYAGKAPNSLETNYNLIKHFPDNKIVLAHWGGGLFFYHLLKKEAKEVLKNTRFDTAASPFLYDVAVYKQAIELVGEDKILFGSDYPLLKPGRYFDEMSKAGLTADQLKQVKGENALQLLSRS